MYTENEQEMEELEAVDIVSPESIQHWTYVQHFLQKLPPYTNNCLTTMTFISGLLTILWPLCSPASGM